MSVVNTVIAAIYTLLSLSGFVAFLVLDNIPGCVWAFVSAMVNAMLTHLWWLKYKNNLDEWYSRRELYPLEVLGFISFTVGCMGIAYHLTIEILLKKPILPINQSEVIPIVWAFITAKSGLILGCTAKCPPEVYELRDVERNDLLVSSVEDPAQEEEPSPVQ